MIYVERDQVDENGTVVRPNDTWFDNAERATEKAIEERNEHVADRGVYAHDELKISLERLFHGKCAYCESHIGAADWDVDHFRPKGRVTERADHPGYYWLTYEWENLYPSCNNCNQHRRGRPLWADSTRQPSGGKADQFPLLYEGCRLC